MAKKSENSEGGPPEHLNALLPAGLKRRMKIAAANTGKTMTDLLVQWIEDGLAKVEKSYGK